MGDDSVKAARAFGEVLILSGFALVAFVAPTPAAPYNLLIALVLIAAGGPLMVLGSKVSDDSRMESRYVTGAIIYQRRCYKMPNTPDSQQQGNVIVALVGSIGLLIGGTITGLWGWLASRVNKSALLESKQADKPGALIDDLQAELMSVRAQGLAQAAALVASDDRHNTLRNDFASHVLASGLKVIEDGRKISHLEIEVEKLTNKISSMETESTTKDSAHLNEITQLKALIAEQNATLAERDATIITLRQEIEDFKKIGVTEPLPPKRGKE